MNFNHAKGITAYEIGRTSQVASFLAGGTIVAGQTVKFDTSKTGEDRVRYVVQGDASALVMGVALEATTVAGTEIQVAIGGYVGNVKTDGSVTSGAALIAAASGALIVATTNTLLPLVGVALETDDATPVADVFLFGMFPFKT